MGGLSSSLTDGLLRRASKKALECRHAQRDREKSSADRAKRPQKKPTLLTFDLGLVASRIMMK